MMVKMGLLKKIHNKAYQFYRQRIVCEQYPMLSSISRKEWRNKGAIGLVYMLHHICQKNPKGIPTNEDLKVSPDFLESIILKYKKQGFNFVSLDDLSTIISSDKEPERPFISFTIDDGYLDNYTQALPVFERLQVPFAIFVATDFINQKAILWWDILEELVQKNDRIKAEDTFYMCRTFQEKWDVFRILRNKILSFEQNNLEVSLKRIFSNYDIDWLRPIREKAMSWEHIKELSQHPLCTIGGHTVSHPALNKLSNEEFNLEITEGIEKLEQAIGKKILHFAYPYGSPNEIGNREYQLIHEFGFKTVFSSFGGCITNDNKHLITHLPRVYLHER